MILITGCGPIGSCAIACAKALGASKVIAVDISDNALKCAEEMGADVLINSGKLSLPLKDYIL